MTPSDEALKAAKEILDVMSKPATGAYAFGHADKQLAEIIDRHMPKRERTLARVFSVAQWEDHCKLLVEAAEIIAREGAGGLRCGDPNCTCIEARLRRAAEEIK